jgi:hypothetical protein
MRNDVALVVDVPCFKCLFWDEKKESHLNCIPGECAALTDWILKQTEEKPQDAMVIAENRSGNVKTHVA